MYMGGLRTHTQASAWDLVIAARMKKIIVLVAPLSSNKLKDTVLVS